LPDGPLLAVLEDETGRGKTEASLILASRLIGSGRATGIYIGLPTQATASAMYGRAGALYRSLFAPEAQPFLALAHGQAHLNEQFRLSVLSAIGDARCSAWIADDRRRALHAHVGVGTLDQALLAVLPVRHAPLRLAGIARKVLVVDEAHACDAYLHEELCALLRFHAAGDGSAIVLSATLPRATRQALSDAWRSGLGLPPHQVADMSFPLATAVSRSGVHEAPLPPGRDRRVAVQRLKDSSAALAVAKEAADRAAAVCIIRSTVTSAQATAALLRAAGLDPLLFHSRYTVRDRARIEAEVLRRWGRASAPPERAGILVATQVVEQSLDIDFDVLITDLAPADLLIQRAGRLWRHARSARPVPEPVLSVIAPAPVAKPPADWLAGHSETLAVYRDPSLLWRSAPAIFGSGVIEAPAGLRDLVEAAVAGPIPPGLAAATAAAADRASVKAATARSIVLTVADGYRRDAGLWDDEDATRTRWEDYPTIRLHLVDGAGKPIAGSWPESMVPTPAGRVSARSEDGRRSPRSVSTCATASGTA